MIHGENFYQWLKGADLVFEALEGRYDMYNICKKWVCCLYDGNKRFIIDREESKLLVHASENLLIFHEPLKGHIIRNFKDFATNTILSNTDKASFALSFYLMTWNIRRFEEYFKQKPDFDLEKYFIDMEDELRSIMSAFGDLRNYHILKDDINHNLVKDLFNQLGILLKKISPINQNENVGVTKIMHILYPYYLLPLDNKIGVALSKTRLVDFKYIPRYRTIVIDEESFIKYMLWIQALVRSFRDEVKKLEEETNKSILKLIDEAFYTRYSINILNRLKS